MGSMQQAVLEFDGEVQAPWRPRLAVVPDVDEAAVPPPGPRPSRRSGSRISASPPAGRRAPASRPVPLRLRRAGLRLTRRARRLALVLALAAGVALGSWLGPLLGGGSDLRLVGDSSVTVQPGDTVWSIATSLERDGDVRALVDEIQRLNGLDGAGLTPGQVLQLP